MANTQQSSGIGFLGLLAIVFITLKLVGAIDWSWWWVLLPLWGPIVLVLIVLVVLAVVLMTAAVAIPDLWRRP